MNEIIFCGNSELLLKYVENNDKYIEYRHIKFEDDKYLNGGRSMKGRTMCSQILLSGILLGCLAGSAILSGFHVSGDNLYTVYAEEKKIQYSYDSLGRVVSVIYPDGTKIIYTYDKNGNITHSRQEQKTTESGSGEAAAAPKEAGGNTTTVTPAESNGNTTTVTPETIKKQDVSTSIHYTAKEIQKYNKFTKRKGKIKSLKVVKKKKKYYLKLTVKKIFSRGMYGETGYQIKYATNKRFKKAKSITFNRTKESLNSKSWKGKKGKTYYVKVRGYMKTRTGKTIYTKYSAVKKITVK